MISGITLHYLKTETLQNCVQGGVNVQATVSQNARAGA